MGSDRITNGFCSHSQCILIAPPLFSSVLSYIFLLGSPLLSNVFPCFLMGPLIILWASSCFLFDSLHSSIGFSLAFLMDPIILLLGPPLFSNVVPFVFEWFPFILLLGSPLFSIGFLFVYDAPFIF